MAAPVNATGIQRHAVIRLWNNGKNMSEKFDKIYFIIKMCKAHEIANVKIVRKTN